MRKIGKKDSVKKSARLTAYQNCLGAAAGESSLGGVMQAGGQLSAGREATDAEKLL